MLFRSSCPTLFDPMDCSTSGFPVHHQLLEFIQTHVHRVGDAIHHLILCCPLLLPSTILPTIWVFSMGQFFTSGGQSFSFSISPSNEYSGLITFRIDWFVLLAVHRTQKSLLQHHSLKASILCYSAIFIVLLTSVHDCWKNHSFDQTDLCWQSNVSAF